MARRRHDDPLGTLTENPLLLAGGLLAGVLVLGGTLAYANSTPERRRRFREGAERAARQSAEAKAHLEREAEQRRLRREYFSGGRGRELYARRATSLAPVTAPFADAVPFTPSLNAFSFGAGFASPAQGARFEYSYDGHDGIGRWRLETPGEQLSGGIAKPDARLTIHCPDGRGLLAEEQRLVIRRLLATPPSRIAEVEFVRADHRAIENAIWQEYVAEHGL